MTTKFTPGPWHLINDDTITDDPDSNGFSIRICDVAHTKDYKANARAIASYPDAHEALIAARTEFNRLCRVASHLGLMTEHRPDTGVMVKIEAALAKAEGRDVGD